MTASSDIQPSEAVTLQAFLVALAKLDSSLPPPLQQEIRQVGQTLERDPKAAIRTIPRVANQHGRLHQLYEENWMDLQRRNPPEQTKTALALSKTTPGNGSWQTAIATTLTARNPVSAARSMIKTAASWVRPRQFQDEAGLALVPLVRTAQEIDEQELTILKALEYHPATVEDLAYAVGMPVEQVATIVASLWEAKQIDLAGSPVWQRVFPCLKRDRNSQYAVDPGMTFTLTMRGHFRLHPLLSNRTVKGTGG